MTQGFFDQATSSMEITHTAGKTIQQVKIGLLAIIVILVTLIRFL